MLLDPLDEVSSSCHQSLNPAAHAALNPAAHAALNPAAHAAIWKASSPYPPPCVCAFQFNSIKKKEGRSMLLTPEQERWVMLNMMVASVRLRVRCGTGLLGGLVSVGW